MYRFFGMSPPESPSHHLSERDLHPFLSSSLPFDSMSNLQQQQRNNNTNQTSQQQINLQQQQQVLLHQQQQQQLILLNQQNSSSNDQLTLMAAADTALFGHSFETTTSDFAAPLSSSHQHNLLSSQLSNMAIDDMSEIQSPLHKSTSNFSLKQSMEELPIFSMDDVMDSAMLGVNPMEIYHPPKSVLNRSLSSSIEVLPISSSPFHQGTSILSTSMFHNDTNMSIIPDIIINSNNNNNNNAMNIKSNGNKNNTNVGHHKKQRSSNASSSSSPPNASNSVNHSNNGKPRYKTNEVKPLFTKEQLQSLSVDALGILTGLSPTSSNMRTSNPIPIPQSATANTPTLSGENASFALSPPSPSTPLSPSFLLSTSPVALITAQAKQGPDGMYGCICGKRYPTLMALRNHAKLHGPRERNFFCQTCKKAFLRKQDLRRHETTHLEDYHPYSCDHCGTTFTRSDALSRHLKARRCMKDSDAT